MVSSFDAKDGAQTALVKPLPIEKPGVCTVQEGGNDDSPAYLELREEAEQVALPHSL